jgi:hypothetical protein
MQTDESEVVTNGFSKGHEGNMEHEGGDERAHGGNAHHDEVKLE